MRINESGGGPVHLAPFPDGPSVEVLVDDGVEGRQLASAKVTLAPGAAMPEHDHGESEALVISIAGELVFSGADGEQRLTPGAVGHIARGERVRVENRSDQESSMMVVFTPPSFVRALMDWPVS